LERQNYWSRRITRRGALAGVSAGGVGLAALGLVGCGDDDNGGNTKTIEQKQEEVKSILWQRTDTTAQAVPGSTYQGYTTADVTNLDPLASPSFTANVVGGYVYPRLLQYKAGYRVPANGEVEASLAEKWEQPEPTKLVLHLRPNAVWEDKAPTNKRAIDADDVLFSWKKFAALGASRKDLVKLSDNPNGPVINVEATDKNTIVFTTQFPYAPLQSALAYTRYLAVMPRESDGGYDPKNETRSGNAWMLSNYQRSVTFQYKKNPNWWGAKNVFLDGLDYPIIPEYASGLAQFRARKIWAFGLTQDDVIATKKDFPEMNLDQAAFGRTDWMTYFGLQPDSPFRDPRVRQAMSMMIDRDLWIETFYNTANYKKEGYPAPVRYHSHISSGWDALWVDPQSKDMGDGAKNYQYNVAEAKKLLSAAGFTSPIETEMRWISTGQYGTTFPKNAEVFKGMFEDSGMFKIKVINPDYATEYLPNIYFGQGNFKGIAVGATTAYPEVDLFMFAYFHTQGARQKVAFQGKDGDAKSDQMIEAQRRELDYNKRLQLIRDWQKYVATTMPMIPYPGQSTGYGMAWPWLGNYGVNRSWDAEAGHETNETRLWFDKSKYTG
jgi:peptide/nickel transport system substrate-binding protein